MKLSEATMKLVMAQALADARTRKIATTTDLHLHDELLPARDEAAARDLGVDLDRDSALVFVDLAPTKNWAHPCEYHLHDVTTGRLYRSVAASVPPTMMDVRSSGTSAFHQPVRRVDSATRRKAWKKRVPPSTNAPSAAPGERYAVLFTGKAENRHTNDMEFLYRTLVDVYDVDPTHIQVCNHDGTVNYFLGPNTSSTAGTSLGNWPGDNTPYRMVVNQPGTRAGLQAAFAAVAATMRPEDSLFIHTNNHGGGIADPVSGGVTDHGKDAGGTFNLTDYCMYAYDATGSYWIPYYLADFITDLGVLPPCETLMVMMEQCRSGGFIDSIIDNSPAIWTHVATAVAAPDYSDGGWSFDPFAEDWIAAMTGQYQDGTGLLHVADANTDGRVSAAEAFTYADACVTGGDTPTASDAPAGRGAFIFLGQPEHDLYLRDNLQDHGLEPLIGGGICCSPDIIVYNQELLDPESTLGSAAAQASDTLGNAVESGQDNFLYLRVQNRGSTATAGTARVFWADPSGLPTPTSWTEITDPANPVAIAPVDPGQMSIVGPIVWPKAAIPGTGHYCFVGLISSGSDPAPDPETIATVDDYYNFIRLSNNATWKNFDVTDVFTNSITNMAFTIQGWPGKKLSADLAVDLSALPPFMEVTLRILKRLSVSAVPVNATLVKDSARYQQYALVAGAQALLRNLSLKASEATGASLDILAPEQTADGGYRLAVAEIIDGLEMGRVTRMLQVGQYPFVGNRGTLEVHNATCAWGRKIGPRNKVAYHDVDLALSRGYNGCRYCLPEFNTD